VNIPLISTAAGEVLLPSKVLCDRHSGGHLIVNPPRPVWERSELSVPELVQWSLLVAATGHAMLDTLDVLAGGCLNYWEAGNWALNDLADPPGPKDVLSHRRVHLHIFGRSRQSTDPDWKWGESPYFPSFDESDAWAARFLPLNADECRAIQTRIRALLDTRYHT
jgi:hypothetical protein